MTVAPLTRLADKEVQSVLRHLHIRIIAIDEAQVASQHLYPVQTVSRQSTESVEQAVNNVQVVDPDPKSGWSSILPFK